MTPRTGLPELIVAGSVATITLCRPAQRNRLQTEDLHALMRHFALVEADPAVRVLVITSITDGQPRPVFCAGYDVGGFDNAAHDPQLFERVADTLEHLRPSRWPRSMAVYLAAPPIWCWPATFGWDWPGATGACQRLRSVCITTPRVCAAMWPAWVWPWHSGRS